MIGVGIVIERFVDGAVPGFVAFTLVDAAGTTWSFTDKVPVVSLEDLDATSTYPRPAWIACTVVARRVDDDGRTLVMIDTGMPWGIEAVGGDTRFEVREDQLEERPE